MLNFETFLKGFHLLKESFEFENSELYTDMVFNALKNITNDDDFLSSCNNILMQTNKEDWNKAYGYKGRPAVKDWIDTFKPRMVEKTQYYKCEMTGAMLARKVWIEEKQLKKLN